MTKTAKKVYNPFTPYQKKFLVEELLPFWKIKGKHPLQKLRLKQIAEAIQEKTK